MVGVLETLSELADQFCVCVEVGGLKGLIHSLGIVEEHAQWRLDASTGSVCDELHRKLQQSRHFLMWNFFTWLQWHWYSLSLRLLPLVQLTHETDLTAAVLNITKEREKISLVFLCSQYLKIFCSSSDTLIQNCSKILKITLVKKWT